MKVYNFDFQIKLDELVADPRFLSSGGKNNFLPKNLL